MAPKLAQSQHWFAGGVSQTKLPTTSTLATIPKHLKKADKLFLIPFRCHGNIQVMYTIKMSTSGEPNIAKSGYGTAVFRRGWHF